MRLNIVFVVVTCMVFLSSAVLRAQDKAGDSPAKASSQESDTVTAPLTPGSEAFVYDPLGKRDPFQPEIERESQVEDVPLGQGKKMPTPAPLPEREIDPLEEFDISQLRVSAIIWDIKRPRAMLVDPNGGVHVVRAKSRIGKKNGFVVSIREGEVVVVEYDAELDQWNKSFKVLELR